MKENQTYKIARVTADQAVNDTVQTAITKLVTSLPANEAFKFVLTLLVAGFALDDIDISLTGPASSVLTYGLSSVTPKVSAGGDEIMVALSNSTLSVIEIEGVISLGATAGNFSPKFGMTADVSGSPLTVKTGSSLEIWQITDTTP